MPATDRGGLKTAFAGFRKPELEQEAEVKLLGRPVDAPEVPVEPTAPPSYQVATTHHAAVAGLTPRPLVQREAVRQLSFRCPVSLAAELRRKAAYNQLEQQEIIAEGIKRVLSELQDPPTGWEP